MKKHYPEISRSFNELRNNTRRAKTGNSKPRNLLVMKRDALTDRSTSRNSSLSKKKFAFSKKKSPGLSKNLLNTSKSLLAKKSSQASRTNSGGNKFKYQFKGHKSSLSSNKFTHGNYSSANKDKIKKRADDIIALS